MTQVSMFAVYDVKAKAYMQPFFAANAAVAFRSCEKAASNPQSPFASFPSDFHLFCLADFDDVTGILTPRSAPDSLGNFIQFLPPASPASDKATVAA